jgi:hypothetical protein
MTGRQRCDLILRAIDEALAAIEPSPRDLPERHPLPGLAPKPAGDVNGDALVGWSVVPKPLVPQKA